MATDSPGMSGYYTSRYSGEEIDALLGMAGSSRTNLLDNWYFADPIDQRGVSGTIAEAGYFIDRWKLVSGSVSIGADGLMLDGTIVQILESAPIGAVTACVLTGTGMMSAAYDPSDKTFSVTGSGIAVIAAKLEMGSQQTLARQDADGGWALNDPPPNKALELLKCQRYQVVYSTTLNIVAVGFASNATSALVKISCPPLRAIPALSFERLYFSSGAHPGANSILVTDVTDVFGDNGSYYVQFKCEGGLTTGEAVAVQIRGGRLILDANI